VRDGCPLQRPAYSLLPGARTLEKLLLLCQGSVQDVRKLAVLVARGFVSKKTAPVFDGGQVALVLSLCESLMAADRPGCRWCGKYLGERGCWPFSHPHRSKLSHPGET